MKKMCGKIKVFFGRDWTLAEKLLMIVCCVLSGIVLGFFIAPVKKGISFGNNNANNYGNTYDKLEDDFWLDDED